MNDEAAIIYGVEFQARALCPQHGESDAIRFLVGTQSLKLKNQVHLVVFDEDSNVINRHVYVHDAGEIWDINSSPVEENILSTCYNVLIDGKVQSKAALWRIPPLDETEPPNVSDMSLGDSNHQQPTLQHVADFDTDRSHVKKILWNMAGDTNKILSLSDRHVDFWDGTEMRVVDSLSLEGKAQLQYSNARFSPHHGGAQLATAIGASVKAYDLRSMSPAFSITNAHTQTVRDMDFNPNKQYYMMSCSDDCKVKFWDTRNLTAPLMTRSDHSHWVWSVRYNGFHDQLILTSSSDSRVVLLNIASLSSEPYGHIDDEEDTGKQEPDTDRIINVFDEHEDSVYAVEWASSDPWIFASLSYDGRLVINRVPRNEKYKILL